MKPAAYHRMSMADKQRTARVVMGAPQPTRCVACGMAVMPAQLEAHERERCQGEPIAPPRGGWVLPRPPGSTGKERAVLD